MKNKPRFINLFMEDIFVLDSEIDYSSLDEIVEEKTEQATSITKEESSFIDETKIYIYTNNPLSQDNKLFLSKILQAVKINLQTDCILLDNQTKSSIALKGKFFYFGDDIPTCSIKGNGIFAQNLDNIASNLELKKTLWVHLQKLYL